MIRFLAIFAASLFAIGLARAQTAPANDYQFRVKEQANIVLQNDAVKIARANAIAALANKMDESAAGIVGALLALGIDLGAQGAPAQTAAALPAPPQPLPECGFGCQVGKGVGGFFGFVERLAPHAAPLLQVLDAGKTSRFIAGIQGQTQRHEATERTNQLVAVGASNLGIAREVGGAFVQGNQSYAELIREALNRDTQSIINYGDGAYVAGRDVNQRNTVKCPQTASATGGQSGNAATGGSGGSAPGATGGNGGNSGAAAPPQVTQRTDCAAGR